MKSFLEYTYWPLQDLTAKDLLPDGNTMPRVCLYHFGGSDFSPNPQKLIATSNFRADEKICESSPLPLSRWISCSNIDLVTLVSNSAIRFDRFRRQKPSRPSALDAAGFAVAKNDAKTYRDSYLGYLQRGKDKREICKIEDLAVMDFDFLRCR